MNRRLGRWWRDWSSSWARCCAAVAPTPTPAGYREPAGSGEMAMGVEGGGQDTLTGLVGEGGADDSIYGRHTGAAGAPQEQIAEGEEIVVTTEEEGQGEQG